MEVKIYRVVFGKKGPLLATVSIRGKVTAPRNLVTDKVEGILDHVKNLQAKKIRGKDLMERLQRSYTNGYVVAEIV